MVGRIKQERWNDSEGKAKSRVVIVAEHVEFRPEARPGQAEGQRGEETQETAAAAETEEVFAPTF